MSITTSGLSVGHLVASPIHRVYDLVTKRIDPLLNNRLREWPWSPTRKEAWAIRKKIRKESWCVESWG